MADRAVGRPPAGPCPAGSPRTRPDEGHQVPDDHADRVRMLFDGKAARWPDKYTPEGRLAGRLAQLSDAVKDRVGDGGELLDLGCGSGELARHLAATGYRVTGCDIAPEMLRHAQAADQAHAVLWILLEPRWHTLPFAPGGLDAVVAVSVLEYVPDPSAVLRQCARVLRPGGTLLFTVPDMAHPVRWLEWPLGLVARTPFARAAQLAWPRLGSYVTYLRISRQRRRVRWWQSAARQAGLQPAALPAKRTPCAPLRLLTFTRTGDAMAPAQHYGGPSEDDGHR
jgi:SAM-dependent methyltransferase